MFFVLSLEFDTKNAKKIQEMKKFFVHLDKNGKRKKVKFPPHISLIGMKNLEIDDARKKIEMILKNFSPFKIKFQNIGIFNNSSNVLFLSPKITHNLLNLHESICNSLQKYLDPLWAIGKLYFPENWIPHCTINADLSKKELMDLLNVMIGKFVPFEVIVKYVKCYKIEEKNTNREIEQIFSISL